jgi:ribosome-associated toxin RatA of RatAB toxin-antitoxin module
MPLVKRSVLVAHSAQKMFALVQRVEDYPKFLPWCGGSSVAPLQDGAEIASVAIDFKGLKQSFSTVNRYTPYTEISLTLQKGPFTSLSGAWTFNALETNACEVLFELNYVFAAGLLGPLLAPVFDAIAGSFIDAFVARAEQLYGS